MGLRTAAAKLGFQLAATTSNKNISSNNLFLRSFNSLSRSTDVVEKEKISNIFLCFDERRQTCTRLDTNIVIRPITLDSYNDYKEEELLESATHRFPAHKDILHREAADSDDDDYYFLKYGGVQLQEKKLRREVACQTRITRLGSEILFTVGQTLPKDICWVDPLIHPVKFHVSSQTETKIKSFSTSKYDMKWGVIGGKLYCFDNFSPSQTFEVLDTEIEETSWKPLGGAPVIMEGEGTDEYSVLFLDESRKILGWDGARPGVYCFDCMKPEKGWIESACGLEDPNSLIGQDDICLVIHDNHPEIGDFNLMFTYDRHDEPYYISPLFISDKCDSFKSINEPVRLPKRLCSKYRVGYCDAKEKRLNDLPREHFDSQFVHLGSKKFCLILHQVNKKASGDTDDGKIKGNILVATFEYDVNISISNETNVSEAPLEIKTRMLGTRRFTYYINNKSAEKSDMIGAFSF